jgi:ADP-ribose pyrophosphatase YjhB (NUDIX family)
MKTLLDYALRLKNISHLGLTYSLSEYDTERYTELRTISLELMALATLEAPEKFDAFFNETREYITPKVDIRGVVFNEKGELLLVKEKHDGFWSLPGGWADIGSSPRENVVREVLEETGLQVEPVRVLAIHDKKLHPHPPSLNYVYKIFILCRITGGSLTVAFDILDKAFFDRQVIPPLSLSRVLSEQVDLMFDYFDNPEKPLVFD